MTLDLINNPNFTFDFNHWVKKYKISLLYSSKVRRKVIFLYKNTKLKTDQTQFTPNGSKFKKQYNINSGINILLQFSTCYKVWILWNYQNHAGKFSWIIHLSPVQGDIILLIYLIKLILCFIIQRGGKLVSDEDWELSKNPQKMSPHKF